MATEQVVSTLVEETLYRRLNVSMLETSRSRCRVGFASNCAAQVDGRVDDITALVRIGRITGRISQPFGWNNSLF